MLSFSIPTRVLHLFTLSLFAAAAFADEKCPSPLSYWGYSGPAQWPKFPIAENQCGGERQSPIDLTTEMRAVRDVITLAYDTCAVTIQNTGHDIEVRPASDANKIKIDGKGIYKLVQFHFHVPSEHTIPGVPAAAEMHILHELETGSGSGEKYAVIGVMITTSETPTLEALAPVFANLPEKICGRSDATINFKGLLPGKFGYYTYVGSLTTPPCTENVAWYVLDAARTIHPSELRKLRALGENARPIQKNPRPLPVTHVFTK
jgi:carbonic anhydrase